MSLKDKEKWDSKYRGSEYVTGKEPSDWLTLNRDLLTGHGTALDIAAGEGRNAVFAASLGYDILAVDVSETGIDKARALAEEKNTKIQTLATDLDTRPWDAARRRESSRSLSSENRSELFCGTACMINQSFL